MTEMRHVLLVEDDKNLSFLLGEHLSGNNLNTTICHDGKKALEKFDSEKIDLCILDIVLPDLDGISLAKEIRRKDQKVPIVFLTSRNLKSDQLMAYTNGADDYLTKPFDPDVLVLKINAILNRVYANGEEKPDHIELGSYKLEITRRRLLTPKTEIKLSKTEAGILELLFAGCEKPVTRDDMMKEVWGRADFFISKSLDVYITRIRKILKEHTSLELETIRGVGYVMVE